MVCLGSIGDEGGGCWSEMVGVAVVQRRGHKLIEDESKGL